MLIKEQAPQCCTARFPQFVAWMAFERGPSPYKGSPVFVCFRPICVIWWSVQEGRRLGVLPSRGASCFMDSPEWCREFISWPAHCAPGPADTCELTPAYWQIISINESEGSALFHPVIYAPASSSARLGVNWQLPSTNDSQAQAGSLLPPVV